MKLSCKVYFSVTLWLLGRDDIVEKESASVSNVFAVFNNIYGPQSFHHTRKYYFFSSKVYTHGNANAGHACCKITKMFPTSWYDFLLQNIVTHLKKYTLAHAGAHFVKYGCLYEKKIGLKLPPFRKGPFLCLSITRKIFHLEPWNLVENCHIDSSFQYKSHYLTYLSYVVFQNFQCKGRLPLPPKSWIFSVML